MEVRQVNETERGLVFVFDPLRGRGDPARRGVGGALRCIDTRGGSPERGKGKLTEVLLDPGADGVRPGVYIKDFAAIGGIQGPGRDRVVCAGVHIVPPKEFGAGEFWI